MNQVDELVQTLPLRFGQISRLPVPSADVDVGHAEGQQAASTTPPWRRGVSQCTGEMIDGDRVGRIAS